MPDLLAGDPTSTSNVSTPQPTQRSSWFSLPVLFVGLVWAGMYLGDLAFIRAFGVNCPHGDDWEYVPKVLQPNLDFRWIFSQHMEHRTPLPRLLVLGLLKVTSLDFRSAFYFN